MPAPPPPVRSAQIKVELEKLEDSPMKQKLLERLELISTTDQRDMVF